MIFPSPEQQRGVSLEKVESLGKFRCPNCAEVEKENLELKKQIENLERLLDVLRADDNEV